MVRLGIWEQRLAIWGFSQTILSLACLSVKPRFRKRSAISSLALLAIFLAPGPPAMLFMATRPTPAFSQAFRASFILGSCMTWKL